jgi:transcription initiation factor IIF auxiliary subunit
MGRVRLSTVVEAEWCDCLGQEKSPDRDRAAYHVSVSSIIEISGQRILTACRDKPSGVEGYPLREWNIRIFLLNEHGEEIPANVYSKVTYHLHESFGKRAHQSTSHRL